jgi:methylmalonyl-CoA mutase
METDNPLQEFPPVCTQAWENIIRNDLKGADYAKKLIWQTPEGLAVKPYYRAEDVAKLELSGSASCNPSCLRSTGDWRIREEIQAVDPVEANHAAQNAVAAGAEEIAFVNVAVRNASDLGVLFVNLRTIPTHFPNAGQPLIHQLSEWLGKRRDSHLVSAGWAPFGNLEFAADIARTATQTLVPFTIHGVDFEEFGATAVEEIGFALAAGVDFLAEMDARNVPTDRSVASLIFSFSIGANYLFEIAKIRAMRMVWATAIESFSGTHDSAAARIYARTSRWNKTIYDPHVNILRATTEAMSAALGGVDSICIAPFDECYKGPDEASRRLARNTQIILKHEAMLSKVADPGRGAYCLEVVTDFLPREAWKSMQKIEADGGYRRVCAEGQLRKALEQSLASRENAVVLRRRVFTGTTQYANPQENAINRIEPPHFSEGRRGAQSFEQLRLRTERHAANSGKLTRVLLCEFGDAKMGAARSNFASNFFACAGFEIVTQHCENASEIAASNADIIVLCSSDPEYLGLAIELAQKLNALGRGTPVVIAGNPESAEQLRAAGVADFIHIRSNPLETLTNWQQRLGIKD